MKITFKLRFHEGAAVRLLNQLAREDALILRDEPALPLLYDSLVVYRAEEEETWCDVINTLLQGHEDCDALAAYRVGEILARGVGALRPGDPGFALARRLRLPRNKRLRAEAFARTHMPRGRPGLYHCLAVYWIAGQEFIDDPSARLGMRGGVIDPYVLARWKRVQNPEAIRELATRADASTAPPPRPPRRAA